MNSYIASVMLYWGNPSYCLNSYFDPFVVFIHPVGLRSQLWLILAVEMQKLHVQW